MNALEMAMAEEMSAKLEKELGIVRVKLTDAEGDALIEQINQVSERMARLRKEYETASSQRKQEITGKPDELGEGPAALKELDGLHRQLIAAVGFLNWLLGCLKTCDPEYVGMLIALVTGRTELADTTVPLLQALKESMGDDSIPVEFAEYINTLEG